jgi:cardiolipin synthase A/B
VSAVQSLPGFVLVLVYAVPAIWAVYHALLYKRDPRAATGWIMICLFVPYAGPVAYFLFGINRVRTRAQDLRKPFYVVDYEGDIPRDTSRSMSPATSGIAVAGERISGNPALGGNAIRALHNGDEAYPLMLEAIRNASHRVVLATYIVKPDRTGTEFADALGAAVRRGVDVKVLVDGFGEMYSLPRISRLLAERDISVARFLPPRLLPPSIYVNLRNHRKLLVVDDELAFAGGMNLSDENTTAGGRERSISDIHFLLRGPSVHQLACIFWNDWQFATGAVASKAPRAAPAREAGTAFCRVVSDGPDAELDALALTIQAALSSATRAIDIMTPYFLPERDLIATIVSAALRGVRVRIVLPAENNLWYVHWANRNILLELLQWGVEVYYQPPPFCHSKLLCVDDAYSLIGSANLDARSLRLNFEIGIEVLSEEFSRELRTHLSRVIATAIAVTHGELEQRTIPVRLRDSALALLSPYL